MDAMAMAEPAAPVEKADVARGSYQGVKEAASLRKTDRNHPAQNEGCKI